MAPRVAVLGAGYAGSGTVIGLEDRLEDADIVWISENPYHLVLHEVHRVIREPAVRDKITIPVDEIKSPSTTFVKGTVHEIDTDARAVRLADSTVEYDIVVDCLGSKTAFYGIEGLATHAIPLKSLDDALTINERILDAAGNDTGHERVRVLVGGAGLSGIQTAGEIAALRDRHEAAIDITLVEGLESILPDGDPDLQQRLEDGLREVDVDLRTGSFITDVDPNEVELGDGERLPYEVLVWTGGIVGPDVYPADSITVDERDRRVLADADFTTSYDRVFAVGDTAHVAQAREGDAPPTAQAAWDAADVVAENVARRLDDRPLTTWTYDDLGTLISIGERAFAHDVRVPPGVRLPVKTFSGRPARVLKKAAAARWIARVASWERAIRAWPSL